MKDSGLVGSTDFGPFWGGFRKGKRCSRDTYPESSINEYTQYTKKILAGIRSRVGSDRSREKADWNGEPARVWGSGFEFGFWSLGMRIEGLGMRV